jgi:hypothetical protein
MDMPTTSVISCRPAQSSSPVSLRWVYLYCLQTALGQSRVIISSQPRVIVLFLLSVSLSLPFQSSSVSSLKYILIPVFQWIFVILWIWDWGSRYSYVNFMYRTLSVPTPWNPNVQTQLSPPVSLRSQVVGTYRQSTNEGTSWTWRRTKYIQLNFTSVTKGIQELDCHFGPERKRSLADWVTNRVLKLSRSSQSCFRAAKFRSIQRVAKLLR